jgi:hypothetical protein
MFLCSLTLSNNNNNNNNNNSCAELEIYALWGLRFCSTLNSPNFLSSWQMSAVRLQEAELIISFLSCVEFCLRYFRLDTRSNPSLLQCNQKQQDNNELTRVSRKFFLRSKYTVMLTAQWQGVACGLATENDIAHSKKGKYVSSL